MSIKKLIVSFLVIFSLVTFVAEILTKSLNVNLPNLSSIIALLVFMYLLSDFSKKNQRWLSKKETKISFLGAFLICMLVEIIFVFYNFDYFLSLNIKEEEMRFVLIMGLIVAAIGKAIFLLLAIFLAKRIANKK